MNHACRPNVSVRHLDQRTALARITMLAKSDIKTGQELVVTYVNPELGLKVRRAELEAWGFGECRCERCVEEEVNQAMDEGNMEVPEEKKDEMEDLERELKVGLGMM
jgi:hypothetical protein